jgi:hypothetical protein
MSYEKYKESIVLTNKARREAVKILIMQHQAEFDELYQYTAIRYGLNTTKVNSRITRRIEENIEQSLEQQIDE